MLPNDGLLTSNDKIDLLKKAFASLQYGATLGSDSVARGMLISDDAIKYINANEKMGTLIAVSENEVDLTIDNVQYKKMLSLPIPNEYDFPEIYNGNDKKLLEDFDVIMHYVKDNCLPFIIARK